MGNQPSLRCHSYSPPILSDKLAEGPRTALSWGPLLEDVYKSAKASADTLCTHRKMLGRARKLSSS